MKIAYFLRSVLIAVNQVSMPLYSSMLSFGNYDKIESWATAKLSQIVMFEGRKALMGRF